MTYTLKYENAFGGSVVFSIDSGFVVSGVTGFSENYIDVSTAKGMGQIGASVSGRAVLPKDIVINGEIVGFASEKKKRLIETVLPGVSGRLVFNDSYFLNVEPKITPIVERYNQNAKFQFTLYAPYPYWKRVGTEAEIIAGIRAMFRFPVNLAEPYRFSERTSEAAANIYNGSNVETAFKLVLTAASEVVNPKVVKVATKQFIKLNLTLRPGDTAIVDMTGQGVLVFMESDGERTDNIGFLDIGSELFPLSPGNNIIRYEADSGAAGLNAVVYFNETVVGVTN